MAHNPAIFNASAFFGDSNAQKGQQDPFWNQHPTSVNHSSGFFDGTAAPVDPFMSNTQGYVDGWDEWPEDNEFLDDETALQNHVLGQENLDTPKLIVPNHNDSGNSVSSVGSTPNGMDPELNAWNEVETTPYAQLSYQNTATYYAHQPDLGAQQVKTYASACQAGMSMTPNHQELQAPQTSQQAFGAQDEPYVPENAPSVELWSREPELGSWSPVFNHDNGPFLTSQEQELSSSSFANEDVGYANDKEVASERPADSSQPGSTTVAPPQNYWIPSMASKQEVLSSPAHLFAGNGGYTPSDVQNTSHPLHDSFQQVGPAKAPAQNYWTPAVPSQQEMSSSPAQLFADNGEYPPSDQKEGTEPSADPFQQVGPAAAANYWTPVTSHQEVPSSSGPASAPAQDYWTPTVPSQQEMQSSPAQLFADNGEYPPIDQKETLTPSGSFQQVGLATAPAQNYWAPMVPSEKEMRSSPAQLFADNGEYPPVDQKEMLAPSSDSFQEVGPATAPAQDYGTPPVPSEQDMQSSSAQLFADNGEYPPFDQKETLTPNGSFQHGPATAAAHDYWTPTVPSHQEMQQSPANHVGPASAPIQNYWTSSMTSQQEVSPLPNQMFTDGGEHLPTGQEQPPGLASDTLQQVGTANASAQKYCMPTMTSEQGMPSPTTQQLDYGEEYPPTGQQAPSPSTDSFQQVDTTTAPAQNHWASTVTSQQEVPSSAAQLFAENGDYLAIGQGQAPRLPAVSFQQVGRAVALSQEDWVPNVTLEQEVPSSAQSHADHGFGLDNTNQQKAENVYGQEKEQQDDAWAPLTEKDILQADLWGNLPVIRRAKDAKPAAVECDLDQEEITQHPQSKSPFTDPEAQELSQQHEQVPTPFKMESTFNDLSASKQLPEVTSEVVPELGSLAVFYQSDPVVEENQPPLYEEGVVSGHTQPSFQDQQVTGDGNLTEQQPLPAPVEKSVKDDFPVEPDSPRDALQTAFLQKQLAGKAPAASPRTSLWMNTDAVLPTSCVLAPAAIVPPITTPEVHNSDQQPPTYKQQKGQPLPSMPALVPVACLTLPSQATTTLTAQEEPVNMVPNFSNSGQPQFVLAEQFDAGTKQSNLNTHPPTSTELPVYNSTRQQNTAPDVPNNNPQAASEVSVPPVVTAPVQELKTESSPNSLAFNSQTAEAKPDILPNYSTSANPPFPYQPPSISEQFNAGINQSNVNPHPPTSSVLPGRNFTRQQNSVPEVPNNNPQAASEVSVPQPVTAPVEEQRTESSQTSLASLLQGGKSRPKKKISQPSASTSSLNTDPGLLQNPSGAYNPSNPSSLPSVPFSSADQPHLAPGQSSQDLSQSLDNQSINSAGRTEELEHSRERDYNDSRGHPRSPEDSYVLNRRDPYYHEDQRDQYGNRSRQDPYQEQERDYDRPYYDRRDSERRGYDRRRDIDRRESDYGRRSYDREYDRRGYDGRDHTRRDSYDNRDSYYAHGYSSRQGRRGYDEHRNSREDLYRGSYHSGRSTPSSDRNSPASYDYSAYASHQYGYPSYTDHQSMDLYQYQYLMYLYQFHPQLYEQYCAQLGYYNMGYTPEQLAQYYGGMYNSAGYTGTEPTKPEETAKSEPERFTPLLYRVQHPLVKFSGGKLLSLIGGEDDETPKCTIASVQMVFSTEEIEVIKLFPGPLSSRYSSRTEVMAYCEKQSAGAGLSGDGVVKSLVWKILANLVKHNGAFVTAELAEIIMENWRNCNSSAEHEFISPEGYPPAEIDSHKHIQVYREMLLAGATKDALEYCMRTGLWGHAMLLASKMDKKVHNDVSNRFMKTMTDFDPIRTVYDHLSGRQPVALLTTDDWQRNLAAMVANPPRQHTQCTKKNMVCLGDTLMSNEQVWEAHLCYLLAGEHFGYPSEEKTKMSMIGIDHRTTVISGRHLPLENLQMMEVLEYAVSLSNEEHHIPVLQSYKFMHLNKLSEAGFTEEALHYAELIGHTIIKHPTNANSTLVKNIREVIDRLNPETQEASEMIEMLDKVLQAKNSPSQISSSVTESESEVEEPLEESSASFFSGYDPSTNTPQHQAEPVEEVQPQLSYTESSVGAPPVHQEPMPADDHQDSWSSSMTTSVTQETRSGGMESQATQPEFPLSVGPQAPEQVPASAPAPQRPFFVPDPPVTRPLDGQMMEEQLEAPEEQHFYDSQWSDGARFEEAQKVEPVPLKEPEPPKKAEEKPKSHAKKKEAKRNSPISGWFSGLLSKVMPRGPNEMILPDDTKKSIYWDEERKRWVNTEEDEQDKAPPPPPPTDMQLVPCRSPMMPLSNAATAGATTQVVGGPVSTPFSPPSVPAPGFTQPVAPGGIPAGMATPPTVSKFSRKAYGGGRLAKKYVDVLNPSGQSSNGPVMLPSSLLPTFPGPTLEFNPANLFVPAPVSASDDTSDTLPTAEPVVGNPGSRPSSRNDNEDGGDQQSQHSRSSSVSLTSAEVRSYMMPQAPDPPPPPPPPQNVAPVFYDPSSFTQPRTQATPRKSRYPGQLRK